MIAGEEMQRRVAAIALAATHDSGFALAGSGAIREHGFTSRPTADVDLFTDRRDAPAFDRAFDLDVDAIRQSGRFSDAELLDGATEHDDGFDRQVFAEALRQVRRIGVRRVREYGVTSAELSGVERRMTDWADEIEAAIRAGD